MGESRAGRQTIKKHSLRPKSPSPFTIRNVSIVMRARRTLKRLMDEFEWIGISNNEAIVRHRGQGHVYRYRPSPEAGWQHLVPSRTEMGLPIGDLPSAFADAARRFAQSQVRRWLQLRR